MFHEYNEREFADNKEHRTPVTTKGNFDPAPDPTLSMQLQLEGRLSDHFPSIAYSQQRESVHEQRTGQQNEYDHRNDSLSLFLQHESLNKSVNDDNEVSKFQKMRMKNATAAAEVDFSYMQRNMEESYQLGLSHLDHPRGSHHLNVEPNFSQGSKVYHSDVNGSRQDPVIMYELPPLHRPPRTIQNPICSSPVQAYEVHIYDYPDLAPQMQHDCQSNYPMSNSTDSIRLQGHAPVQKGRQSHQDMQVHRNVSSLLNSSLDPGEGQGSQVPLHGSDSLRQSSGNVNAAMWEEASRYHEDMKYRQQQQQEAYDQQQAFLNFLRLSNAPHGVNKYTCRSAPDDVENPQVGGKFRRDGREPLDNLGGGPQGSISPPAGVHSEAVFPSVGISSSLLATQDRSGVFNFQDEAENMSKCTYEGTRESEFREIYSNSASKSLSANKNAEFKTSIRRNVQRAHKTATTGRAFTPSLQAHSGPLDLECNYNATGPHSAISELNSFQAMEQRTKQVFRTEKQRRDFIKEKYKTLQSLVPRYTKTDRASVIGDTIHYIHVLRQTVKELTFKKEELTLKKEEMQERKKKTERSKMTREVAGEGSNVPKILEKIFADFCDSDERELRLKSKHGAVVEFQITTDKLLMNLVQKCEPYFLNRLLTSLSGLNLVHMSGGIIKNHHVLLLIFEIKDNLRATSAQIMARIMETLDQVL